MGLTLSVREMAIGNKLVNQQTLSGGRSQSESTNIAAEWQHCFKGLGGNPDTETRMEGRSPPGQAKGEAVLSVKTVGVKALG